jgi:entericidin B
MCCDEQTAARLPQTMLGQDQAPGVPRGAASRTLKMIKKFVVPMFALLFVASTLGSLTGCNTVAGAGADIEQGGKAIKDEAREKKDKM